MARIRGSRTLSLAAGATPAAAQTVLFRRGATRRPAFCRPWTSTAPIWALLTRTSQAPLYGGWEINWDGVPDALASPNSFPANFFNVNSPRGTVFSTPGKWHLR